MIAAVCMFIVHLYLALAHPLMWAALVSMRFGYTSASYAAEHHAKWYYGPKRAQELYEAKKKAASIQTLMIYGKGIQFMAKILVVDDDRDFIKIPPHDPAVQSLRRDHGGQRRRRSRSHAAGKTGSGDSGCDDVLYPGGAGYAAADGGRPEPQKHSGHHVHVPDRGAGAAESAVG